MNIAKQLVVIKKKPGFAPSGHYTQYKTFKTQAEAHDYVRSLDKTSLESIEIYERMVDCHDWFEF